MRKPGDPRSDVAVDRDRIVHSHAFRRLQRKTQIVGVQTHDFFRTRLTHTIECAQLGRAIANRLTDDSWQQVVEQQDHLPDLVEAACLAHDLGHPPFGHTGEEALDEVMRQRAGVRFEGNAQSFRIVTLLEPKKYSRQVEATRRPLGLDLTQATLRARSKYPWTESDERAQTGHGKFGVYDVQDDLEYFSWLWQGNPGQAQRTLATDILEAADDLAYAVHDVEDGIWSRLIPVDQVTHQRDWAVDKLVATARRRYPELFSDDAQVVREIEETWSELRGQVWAEQPFSRSRPSEAGLKSFCSKLTNDLITSVTRDGALDWNDNIALQRRIAALKSTVWVFMIEQPALVTRRHGQRRILFDLFDGYMNEPEMLPYPDEWHRIADRDERERVRLVCDHIASMTDNYAVHVHGEMFGGAAPA